MKTASIIIIGNEILSGRTKDTNSNYLAKILVKKGQIVSEGQVIGKMGRTGRVDGAHLHYEILKDKKKYGIINF